MPNHPFVDIARGLADFAGPTILPLQLCEFLVGRIVKNVNRFRSLPNVRDLSVGSRLQKLDLSIIFENLERGAHIPLRVSSDHS